jgi:glycosyltransferase involved in cell wall biosynthesis
MTNPFFSIIIPTLNEEKFIPKLLLDLSYQKDKNFEIIIVDGNSSDKTKEVVSKFKTQLPINFFTVDKRNVSYQRNLGTKKASGRYLIFLDADSGVRSNFIKKTFLIINKKKGLIFLPSLEPEEKNTQLSLVFDFINFLIEFSQITMKPFSSGGALIIEKNFFNLIGGFDENLFIAEDHHLVQKASGWGVRAKFLREVKVKFSLRRIRKEGELKIFYKYLLTTAQYLLKGKVKQRLFQYPMGGHLYQTKKSTAFIDNFNYLKLIKKFFKKNFFIKI